MKLVLLMLASVSFWVACGEGDSEEKSEEAGQDLVGGWSLDVGDGCYSVLVFNPDNSYRSVYLCASGNQALSQESSGTWSVLDQELTFDVTETNGCKSSESGGKNTGTYTITGEGSTKNLRLETNTQTSIYQWGGDDPEAENFSGVVIKGCFSDEGFTPNDGQPDVEKEVDPLVGTWAVDLGNGCSAMHGFTEDNVYNFAVICAEGGNKYSGQFSEGTWSTEEDVLTTKTTDFKSCEEGNKAPISGTYVITGDVLTYERVGDDPKPSSHLDGLLKKGCYGEDGELVPYD